MSDKGISTLAKVRKAMMGTPHELTSDVVELNDFVAISVPNAIAAKEVKSYLFMRGWEGTKLIPNNQRQTYLVLVEKRQDE